MKIFLKSFSGKCETERTGAPHFCSEVGPPPFPISLLYSADYYHLKDTGHVLDSKGVKILDKERDERRRGIKEAIWERVEDPALNRKGGLRFSLSHTWDRALVPAPRRLSRDSELSRDKLH